MHVLLENGAGSAVPGAPAPTVTLETSAWPPPGSSTWTAFAGPDGALLGAAPTTAGADAWRHDPVAGLTDFFGPRGYELLTPLWDQDWTRFAAGDAVSYVTAPFDEAVVLGGPGVVSLVVRSPEADDVHVQVTLTEVRPDGNEVFVQSGWLRLGHRAGARDGLTVDRTFAREDFAPVVPGTWTAADVSIPAFAHPFRAGSRLRMIVSSPGRDHGTWLFEAPDYAAPPTFHLGRGGDRASAITLVAVAGFDVPPELPPCPSLRGQPCRAYEPAANVVVE